MADGRAGKRTSLQTSVSILKTSPYLQPALGLVLRHSIGEVSRLGPAPACAGIWQASGERAAVETRPSGSTDKDLSAEGCRKLRFEPGQ